MTALNEAISEMVQVAFEKYEGVGDAMPRVLRERKIDTSRHVFRNRRLGFSGSVDELADARVRREREVLPQGFE